MNLTDDDLRHLLGEAAAIHRVPDGGAAEVLAAVQDEPAARLRGGRRLVLAAASVAVLAVVGAVALQAREDAGPQVGLAAPASLDYGKYAPDVVYTGMPSQEQAVPGERAAATAADGASASAAKAGGAAAKPVSPAAQGAAVDGARVVKRGTVGLLVEDGQVTPTLTRVQGFATAAGGLVAVQQSQEAGESPSGSVTLRVPVAGFERLVQQVRSAAPEVATATTSGQDVTAQYADLEAQLTTLKAARERFLAILSRADSIGDVLAVQQRVDDVTGRIDRLEGQRRVLAAQSDTATLEVTVTERDDPSVRTVVPDSGLSKALRDARDGFVDGVEALVRWSGPGLLVLLVLAALAGLARTGRRVLRRRLL